MKINKGAVVTAVVDLVVGVALGTVVALAMHRDLHSYLHYVGVLMIISIVVVLNDVRRHYVTSRHSPEEEPAP